MITQADNLRVRESKAAIQLFSVRLCFGPWLYAVLHRGFGELVDQPVRGVEGCSRALRDISDAGTAQFASLFLGGCVQIDAFEGDCAAGNPAAGPGETHGGDTDGRFAGAGFADQAQHLATP